MLSYSASQTTTPPRGPIRLYAVKGYNGRSNDICYCPPLIKQKTSDDKLGKISNSTVVYFGGDVQVSVLSIRVNYINHFGKFNSGFQ